MRISDWSSNVCSSDLDRGGVEQQLRPHQRHHARAFGIPLIPADPGADAGAEDVPDLEPVVAGAEVVLFLVARAVGDDRKSVVWGKRMSVRVARGVRRIIKKNIKSERSWRTLFN